MAMYNLTLCRVQYICWKLKLQPKLNLDLVRHNTVISQTWQQDSTWLTTGLFRPSDMVAYVYSALKSYPPRDGCVLQF